MMIDNKREREEKAEVMKRAIKRVNGKMITRAQNSMALNLMTALKGRRFEMAYMLATELNISLDRSELDRAKERKG